MNVWKVIYAKVELKFIVLISMGVVKITRRTHRSIEFAVDDDPFIFVSNKNALNN